MWLYGFKNQFLKRTLVLHIGNSHKYFRKTFERANVRVFQKIWTLCTFWTEHVVGKIGSLYFCSIMGENILILSRRKKVRCIWIILLSLEILRVNKWGKNSNCSIAKQFRHVFSGIQISKHVHREYDEPIGYPLAWWWHVWRGWRTSWYLRRVRPSKPH